MRDEIFRFRSSRSRESCVSDWPTKNKETGLTVPPSLNQNSNLNEKGKYEKSVKFIDHDDDVQQIKSSLGF